MCLYVLWYQRLSVCLSLGCMSVCLFVSWLSVSIYLSLLSLCLSVSSFSLSLLSVCQSLCLSVLSDCLFVLCLPVCCQSVCLSVCLYAPAAIGTNESHCVIVFSVNIYTCLMLDMHCSMQLYLNGWTLLSAHTVGCT